MKLFFNIIFHFLFWLPFSSAIITFENNTYKGIVIAINSAVEDDYTIIENLKTLLTSASKSLYKATRQRGYFGEITIVVPPNWVSRPEYEPTLGGSRFETADVRIDRSNPHYGNNPYTLQPGGCGEPGQYIHLTSEFIHDLNGSTTEEYGDPAKTFVHEWAHLRYGVFDEYGDEEDYRTPPYYTDENNQIRPTGCGENIKGWLVNENYEQCHRDENGLPDENCKFYPDISDNNAEGSIMYMQWLPAAEGFCDNEDLKHNYAAPTPQNLMCKGESVWSIVAAHSDFANYANPPRVVRDTTPKFRIIQPRNNEKGNYVLVLDVSGSMSGRRINMLHRAASRFVKDQVPDHSQLGIVAFSTQPRILANMTAVTNDSREFLLRHLPLKDDDGNTGIGLGLKEALRMLNYKQHTTEGAIIILISDGEENVSPYVADVINEIRKAAVTIHTIAFGSKASQHLEKLVRLTGGRGFFYSDDEIHYSQASVLQQAFFAAASTQADVDFQPIEVTNQILFLDEGSEKKGSVKIDKFIGKNTKFIFSYNFTGQLDIILHNPLNEVYNSDSKEYNSDYITKSITFTFPMATPGKWIYTIKNNNQVVQGIGFMVTSETKDITHQPVRVRSWTSDVEFSYPNAASTVKVFAEVKKQYVPVINANVLAMIERPDGKTVELQLHDNGAGADTKKNDGIYSAYFTEFFKNGRYSVAARVVNDGQAKLKRPKKKNKKSGAMKALKPLARNEQRGSPAETFSSEDLAPPISEDEVEYVEEPIDEFERSLLAGSFRLQEWKPGDIIPPNRVTDLKVDTQSAENRTISLSWTAPGNDMENGNASSLELRYHTKIKLMWQNFTDTFVITEDDLLEGSLTPPPGGARHQVTIKLNNTDDDIEGMTFYFGLRCKDDYNNTAEVSNIASAYFVVHYPEVYTIPASQYTILIVGSIIGTLLIAILCIVSWKKCQQRTSTKKVFA